MKEGQTQEPVGGMKSLPSIDEAGVIAVRISENIEPKLTAKEQSFFIAGFQECIKWLSASLPQSSTEEEKLWNEVGAYVFNFSAFKFTQNRMSKLLSTYKISKR